jgi:hypothetical protein
VILCHMLWWGDRMAGQSGLFDVDERYASLTAAGDPLERLAVVIDFELSSSRRRSIARTGPGAAGRRTTRC